MKSIKYICFFDSQEVNNERYYVVAATNKMQYIINVLYDAGITPHLISCSWSVRDKFGYVGGFTDNRDHYSITFFPSFGGNRILSKVIKKFLFKWNLFWYLIRNTKRDEVVMAYHSNAYSWILKLTRAIKKYKLILEVEEIYQDVKKTSFVTRIGEYSVINKADAYIFSTELLKEKLNTQGKPDVIIYGTYNDEEQLTQKYSDGKTHVVYAGTFDPRKGGSMAAAAAAAYLPNNFVVHICGFGNAQDTSDLLKSVEMINKNASCAHVSYEGLLKGRTYIQLLQQCHIGLSTQNPNAAFNATSFPSKILSYMSNGLSVVSIRIAAVERSAIGESVFFYNSQNPEDIAHAILSSPVINNNKDLISHLDRSFRKELIELLNVLY